MCLSLTTNSWDNYLKTINKKYIRPYKAQGTIFGTEAKKKRKWKKEGSGYSGKQMRFRKRKDL